MGRIDELTQRVEALESKIAASPDLARLREHGMSARHLEEYEANNEEPPAGLSKEQAEILADVFWETRVNVLTGFRLPSE